MIILYETKDLSNCLPSLYVKQKHKEDRTVLTLAALVLKSLTFS